MPENTRNRRGAAVLESAYGAVLDPAYMEEVRYDYTSGIHG